MRDLVRLGIRVRPGSAETALEDLAPVLAAGAEEVALPGGVVEYAVYGAESDLPADGDLRALAGAAILGVSRAPVAAGWETAYHDWVPRVEVEDLPFAIRPPWLAGPEQDLVIDPGAAFGAATHPSTRLALRLLAAPTRRGSLADWGTGTGILAVAAARLGHGPVRAVDLADAELVRANAARAGVELGFDVVDLMKETAPVADTVVANLEIVVHFATAAVQPRPPRLLLSGVFEECLDDIVAAWAPLREVRRLEEDGWGAVELVAP